MTGAAWIITWTEGEYTTREYNALFRKWQSKGSVNIRWRFWQKNLAPGDTVFLLRQRDDSGICAAGTATSERFSDEEGTFRATISLTEMVEISNRLPRQVLDAPPLQSGPWASRVSGARIPEDVAEKLRATWRSHLAGRIGPSADQTSTIVRRAGATPHHEPQVPPALDPAVLELLKRPELKQPKGDPEPSRKTTTTTTFSRATDVRAWVLHRAAGCCESCRAPAPFRTADDVPYLEEHHLVRLADGGPDTPENTVAVCPNCHRALHYAADRDARAKRLRERNVTRISADS